MDLLSGLLIPTYPLLLIYTFFSTMISFLKNKYEFTARFTKITFVIAEILFTVFAPLLCFYRFDTGGYHLPFANQHVLILVVLILSSSVSFWISKLTFHSQNPIVRIIISIGLLQGMILCGVITIHFFYQILVHSLFSMVGFKLLSPFIAFFILLRQYYFYTKEKIDLEDQLPYRVELGLIPLPYKIVLAHGLIKLLIYSVMVVAVLVMQMALGCFIGLDIDAIVKVFTHSSGFVFSRY